MIMHMFSFQTYTVWLFLEFWNQYCCKQQDKVEHGPTDTNDSHQG